MTAQLPTADPLVGPHLVLRALAVDDLPAIARTMLDERVYAHGFAMHHVPVDEADAATVAGWYLSDPAQLDGRGNGRRPYAVTLAHNCTWGAAGDVVGTSSLAEVHLERESAHLGWTVYSPDLWGTGINAEAKWLLLRHAFEDCRLGRVKIQTDVLNTRSQAAIARLGATREGVLRREQPREDGSWRDTVVFSIVVDEWPEVSERLQARFAD